MALPISAQLARFCAGVVCGAALGLWYALLRLPRLVLPGRAVTAVVDYQPGIDGLPPANVIEFQLEGSGKVIIRPSGTEPKVKAYLFGHADTRESTSAMCAALETEVTALLRA